MKRSDEIDSQEQARLQEEHLRINEEIRYYPRPIAACDLQFNHLLEQRAMIALELAQLQKAEPERPTEAGSKRKSGR